MKCVTIGTVQSNQKVADQIFLAKIEVSEIARQCLPGQFVNIYFPDSVKLFPRPFSIAGVSGKSIIILYKVIGSQTTLMSRWQIGHQVKLLGPLGNSFTISKNKSIKYVLLAGGVGAAPLMFFCDEFFASSKNKRSKCSKYIAEPRNTASLNIRETEFSKSTSLFTNAAMSTVRSGIPNSLHIPCATIFFPTP